MVWSLRASRGSLVAGLGSPGSKEVLERQRAVGDNPSTVQTTASNNSNSTHTSLKEDELSLASTQQQVSPSWKSASGRRSFGVLSPSRIFRCLSSRDGRESEFGSFANGSERIARVTGRKLMLEEEAEEVRADNVLLVMVPPGARPGDKLKVTAPNGSKVLIVVPAGAACGSRLEFVLPESISSQTPPRGGVSEGGLELFTESPTKYTEAVSPDGAPYTDAQRAAAASLVQSVVRGRAARSQERRRRAWLSYYIECGQYEAALRLPSLL